MQNSIEAGKVEQAGSLQEIEDRSENTKGFGLVSLTCIVVASMIGAGAFTTSGFSLEALGSPDRVMAAWMIGGAIAILGALSYGTLARHFSESGGEYLYLSRIMHPLAGFIAGFVSLVAGFTGALAFAALAFEAYAAPLLPVTLPPGVLAILVIIFAAVLHGFRVGLGTYTQNLVVIGKLILLSVFLFIAFTTSETPVNAGVPTKPFSISEIAGALVWISLSYSGYNAAVYVSAEARERSTVWRSMWIGTLIVTAIYVLVNAVFAYMAPFELVAGKEDVAAVAAQHIGGTPLAVMVRVIISLALLTSVSAMIMLGPRVYARMAEDRMFPAAFKFRDNVPTFGVIIQAGAALLLIMVSSLKDLLGYLGFTLSLCVALTVSCLFILWYRGERTHGGAVRYLLIPGLFILSTGGLSLLALSNKPLELLASVSTFVVGGVLYLLAQRFYAA